MTFTRNIRKRQLAFLYNEEEGLEYLVHTVRIVFKRDIA